MLHGRKVANVLNKEAILSLVASIEILNDEILHWIWNYLTHVKIFMIKRISCAGC